MIGLCLMWASVARAEGAESLWYDFENRAADAYVLAPSALPVGRGRGYVSQKAYYFTTVAVGIHENVTLVAGTSLPLLLVGQYVGDDDLTDAHYGAKASWEIGPAWHLGGGAEARIFSGDLLALSYLSGTWGHRDSNLTLNVGGAQNVKTDDVDGLVSVGGQHRMGEHVALVGEAWLFLDETASPTYSSYGLRFLSQHWTVDVTLSSAYTFYSDAQIPWINVAYHWG